MSGFNPDAFLEETKPGGFDPDAFLAGPPLPVSREPGDLASLDAQKPTTKDRGLGSAVLHKALSGFFKRHSDELAGKTTAYPEMNPLSDPRAAASFGEELDA